MSFLNRLKIDLEKNSMSYSALYHYPSKDIKKIASDLGVSEKNFIKSEILKLDNNYAIAVLPSDKNLNIRAIRKILTKSKIGLAKKSEIRELFPDCEIGTIPPFGNLYNLRVYADNSIKETEKIVFTAGTYTDAVEMYYRDYINLVHPTIINLTNN